MRPILNPQLGEFVRRQRERRGLSLRQAAAAVGINFATLSRMEAGQLAQPGQDLLRRLALTLECDPVELYALAGYEIPDLPTFAPYLRTKYGQLPEEAIKELSGYFGYLQSYYGLGDSDADDRDDKPRRTPKKGGTQ